MQNTKLIAAIIFVAGLLIWPVGWQLYIYQPELKQVPPTEFQNYLIIAILGTYIVAGAGIASRRTQQDQPNAEPKSPPMNPESSKNTTGIDKFSVRLDSVEEELKQIKRTVTGLQVFFKQENKEEEKPSA